MKKSVILTVVMLFSLTGCWDKAEIEQNAFPVTVGLDKGEGDSIDVTYEIANPREVSSVLTQGKPNEPSEIITLNAPDLLSAKDLVNTAIMKDVRLSHLKTIVISEELARSEAFTSIVQATLRDRQIRRNINMIVSRERAATFIRENNPELERRPHKFYELMVSRYMDTGLLPQATLYRYFDSLGENPSLFLAVYATASQFEPKPVDQADDLAAGELSKYGSNPVQILGSAVFKNGKMVSKLTGIETRLSLLLRPDTKADNLLSDFNDPKNKKYHIVTRLMKKEPTIIDIQLDQEVINVTVPVNIELLAVPSQIDYVNNIENKNLLIRAIENQLNESAKQIVKKTQEDFQADAFEWTRIVRQKFKTWEGYMNYSWEDHFPQYDVNVNFDVELMRFGKQLSPSQGGQ
ncbi:Ger(x)C family spore germination protein [Caldalkalibacillus salinus]|uniref:Ger(x)C family spore germination protein n=1 Tax=Caldalkalibacillus salinus TaxID=2803787 RepID=UPI001924532C|nr:Ger(x)C family spore germination protein [Caldalkalibacillus salinus]